MAMRRGPREATSVWDDPYSGGMDNDDYLDGLAKHEQSVRLKKAKGVISGPSKAMDPTVKAEFAKQAVYEEHARKGKALFEQRNDLAGLKEKAGQKYRDNNDGLLYADQDDSEAHEKYYKGLLKDPAYVKANKAFIEADQEYAKHEAKAPPESTNPVVVAAMAKHWKALRAGPAPSMQEFSTKMSKSAAEPTRDELVQELAKKDEAHEKLKNDALWRPSKKAETAKAKKEADKVFKKMELKQLAEERSEGRRAGPLMRGGHRPLLKGKKGGSYYLSKGGSKVYTGGGSKGKK